MSSAFGVPVTDQMLRQLSRYKGRSITQEDRAREAMRFIASGNKNIDALEHALKLKHKYGNGASTLCLIYNATGNGLELAEEKDWAGSVYNQAPPRSFENGQWIAFLHVTSAMSGSKAARVYRGVNIEGVVRDFMVCWHTHSGSLQNSAYTEVREKDHFPPYWHYIQNELLAKTGKINSELSDEYCAATVSIGGYTSSEFIAVLQHKFSPLPEEL